MAFLKVNPVDINFLIIHTPFFNIYILASNLDNSTKKPFQNDIGRVKDVSRSSVTQI